MPQQQAFPASLQAFVQQQQTLPLEHLVDAAEPPEYPYGDYYWRVVACILLSGRVKPKADDSPNMTDLNRLCKEANFNQYLCERTSNFLLQAQIIAVPKYQQPYAPGEYSQAFWQRDIPGLQQASRRALLAFINQRAGYQTGRSGGALQSHLDIFVALFTAAFHGLAVHVDQIGQVLLAFSQLPAEDLQLACQQLGFVDKPAVTAWQAWLNGQGQQAVLSALYLCSWAYVEEHQKQKWFFVNEVGRCMLGLDEAPPMPPPLTELKVLANLCVLAGVDLPLTTLVPLFRYCKIKRLDRLVEFQFDKRQLADLPSQTSAQEELLAVLQPAGPLPATISNFLSGKRAVTGSLGIRGCSAIIKPENAAVLEAIRAHRRLKGYLETGAPPGYMLIKEQSNPHEFVRRCQELGFTVTSL